MTRISRVSALSFMTLALLATPALAGQVTPINLMEPAAGKTALPPISSDLVEKVVAATEARKPVLTFSEESLPPEIAAEVYSRPARAPDVTPQKIMSELNDVPSQTVVGRKISELNSDLNNLKRNVTDLSSRAQTLQKNTQAGAASYYAAIATISTQLQSGTTPGNPRLVQRLASAQDALENLADRIGAMSDLGMEIANQSSFASYLLESARAAYGLTGAMEEDHTRLAQLEDSINNTVVVLERLQNNTSDDVTRTSAYLATERSNLRALGLAIENGDMYGKALSTRPFSSVPAFQGPQVAPAAGNPTSISGNNFAPAPRLQGPRPLAKIRFDRDNVDFQEPIYLAVHEALEKYPDATFDLVAVHPEKGNPAQVAIESSRARRNAEKVLRTLTEMGLGVDRINLSYAPSATASSNEVHLYIR